MRGLAIRGVKCIRYYLKNRLTSDQQRGEQKYEESGDTN